MLAFSTERAIEQLAAIVTTAFGIITHLPHYLLSGSVLCSLALASGLIYLLLKHLVDRYNLYFAYKPSKIDHYIHASAVNFVIVAVILLQAFVLFFVYLRAGMCAVVNSYEPVCVLS